MFKFLSVLPLLAGFASAGPILQPLAYSVSPLAYISGIQSTNTDSRMFYQKSDGSIWQTCISGHFVGGRTTCDTQIVPRTEAISSTPIASVANSNLSEVSTAAKYCSSPSFTRRDSHTLLPVSQWHLFFVSPTNTLSEYIYQASSVSASNPSGIRGGASCADCITSEKLSVFTTKNKALEAFYQINNDTPKLRVWFISAGQTTTITEAGKEGTQVL
ncbi:hypothetical protein AAF712_004379 [Marasmius tenuissimus]|uniref:Uncharacterized protein n=1 Tax=Marasmius tenuissimus TaxID=585030 RepID=A0ABR3A4Z8_9AGAR